jgi:hypothetical protein
MPFAEGDVGAAYFAESLQDRDNRLDLLHNLGHQIHDPCQRHKRSLQPTQGRWGMIGRPQPFIRRRFAACIFGPHLQTLKIASDLVTDGGNRGHGFENDVDIVLQCSNGVQDLVKRVRAMRRGGVGWVRQALCST